MLRKIFSAQFRETFKVMWFFFFKVPMIVHVRPSVINIDDNSCTVKIPLMRRTKNHLNSMYFGALSVGADLTGGLMGFRAIDRSGKNVVLVFKDFHADFLRRAEGDVHFVCNDGPLIFETVQRAVETKERQNQAFTVEAYVPSIDPNMMVAKFTLTLSVKLKS